MATTWEHATLTANITSGSRQIVLTKAGGPDTLKDDGATVRHMMEALDSLSEDGWEVVGSGTVTQTGDFLATAYLLRRLKRGTPKVY